MSRGGRGRGTNKSFSREQLSSLGVGSSEVVPGPVTQPPPLFPLLDHKPIGLNVTIETKYLIRLKEDFIDHIRSSPAHIKLSANEEPAIERSIDKINRLVAQPTGKNRFDWALFPSELRPKLLAKKFKKPTTDATLRVKSVADIVEHLNKLEHLEKNAPLNAAVKQEEPENDEENELLVEDEEEDEEMDDGTDYANNYFDNGEAYEDEDDNLEDGPCY